MSSISKTSEVKPGMFVDLTGVKLPVLQGMGAGRRYVPNWVRDVKVGRKWVHLTLGDYRVVKILKDEAFEEDNPYCICDDEGMIRRFFCPEHSGFFIPQGEKRTRNNI